MSKAKINSEESPKAVRGRAGGLVGGPARARALSAERRAEIARQGAFSRWEKAKIQPVIKDMYDAHKVALSGDRRRLSNFTFRDRCEQLKKHHDGPETTDGPKEV